MIVRHSLLCLITLQFTSRYNIYMKVPAPDRIIPSLPSWIESLANHLQRMLLPRKLTHEEDEVGSESRENPFGI